MHPVAAANRFTSSSSSAARGNLAFPERYLDSPTGSPEPDSTIHLPNDVTGHAQPVAASFDMLDSGHGISSFWSQSWLEQGQPVLHQNSLHNTGTTSPHPVTNYAVFPDTPILTDQVDWDMLQAAADQAGDLSWAATHSEVIKIEDDSDSIPSLNDGLESIWYRQSSWPPAQKLRRQSMPKVAKPSRLSTAGNTQHAAAATAHTNRRSHTSGLNHYQVQAQVSQQSPLSPQSSESSQAAAASATADTAFFSDDPSTKLLCKRIAHKLSEKSRRNRLTVAIREIQKLMPQDPSSITSLPRPLLPGELSQSTVMDAGGGGASASKVDVVELAVGYIRRLKKENEDATRRAEEAEEQLRVCREALARAGDTATHQEHQELPAVESEPEGGLDASACTSTNAGQ
ncbi:hypothetical protein B0T24DRAFT_297820 [Lasiosphaeria ovina]|uniref:BHLH domain-containing protein n=1 Tax=Lasiosphaeria ovina TaxID=92902 RepID=A0AAE0KE61_9PEZI|nr:hypothetical protein B0T24DRAFT_297820 [Lasiosphaeria ovina]